MQEEDILIERIDNIARDVREKILNASNELRSTGYCTQHITGVVCEECELDELCKDILTHLYGCLSEFDRMVLTIKKAANLSSRR